jgi:molecular chaperone GrpE (heat shock protein)
MRLLVKGKNVREVKDLSRPVNERVASSLLDVIDSLGQVLQLIGEGSVKKDDVDDLVKISRRVQRLAVTVQHELGKLLQETSPDE